MSNYLTEPEMASLVEAIQSAEYHSTGELRIHIDSHSDGDNAAIAFEIFKKMCQGKTAEENAVLFHVNFDQQYLTIIGDAGIHRKVQQEFWDALHDRTTRHFARGEYFMGLKKAVLETGLELKKHFPVTGENYNELSNEITFS